MQKISFNCIADGGAMNFDIGFEPDKIVAFELTSSPEIVYRYYKALADAETTGQYGIEDDGAGALSMCASAAEGFATYTEGEDLGVMILHPGSGKLAVATVADWLAATDYSSGERSATAIGTIVRPPIHNGRVFELTTDTSTGDSEPSSWDVEPGETVTDGGGNIWTCRKEVIKKSGGRGFTVGATLSVNSDVWVFECEKHDRVDDFGDVDGYDPVKFPV